jgi:hypothetical protein
MSVSKERWRELCRQAAVEKDPKKLVKLYDEINAILQRANGVSDPASVSEQTPLTDRRPA